MEVELLYPACLFGVGSLIFIQSLAELLVRRRLWLGMGLLVGSLSLLLGVGIDALGLGSDTGTVEPASVVLVTIAFVLVLGGTVGRFVDYSRA
ncbi:hypothetical protein C448_11451 [Halococcus morrhuae DSM 1307]|uniref:Uncharacterized protein n=1 Tax=Halococcus morrhuae DSM 1307 TaxID=931277 RepID=M0M9X2_HALMO|nr:hypothetical protein [Halococcus morrhuae]EMA42143.1 hypothetical protein C448_11451 [Halococcus morrhuae DSM 1307]